MSRNRCHKFKPAEIVAYMAAIEVLRALGEPWNFNVVVDNGFSGDRWSRHFYFGCGGDCWLPDCGGEMHVCTRCIQRVWIATAADYSSEKTGFCCFRFRWRAGEIIETIKVEVQGEIWEQERQEWERDTYVYNFDTSELQIEKNSDPPK
ncbi:MAG: hypothetical protein Athens101428_309 [Candidatus Berkelbacteria bacterium Athens1014_28]|uniref:Uncharacterized protein n=1 Tax=Candidatus Berkelbacteria bacterium Athens1014_28 TaxID=2017145 RepID=A0A554LN90_9BACT|nr:MAG: hypothetical protein Athens101428_309 [Candidatus Berkelbacteria bacterium Athens1014_28]